MSNLNVRTVTKITRLASGYVRVSASAEAWAQLPESTWNALEPGEMVPREFTFSPDWNRLAKPLEWHDDKAEERTNLHTPTGAGDLDLAGRPMRQGS
jgi:hypothetical protein